MKPLQLSIILLVWPVVFHAQTLTGLWMGKMTNDSNTVRKDDEYEIVLTEYRNKVYGYTRNTFFVGDNLFYIVKKVEGEITGNTCEVKDAGVIMHNFPQKPDKKVKVSYTFRRNPADSTWNLDGEWKTNTTKKYYSISGKSDLSQERDLSKAKIFPHLEELNETKDIAFYTEWKREKESAVAVKDNLFKQEFLKSLVKAEQEKNSFAQVNDVKLPAVNTSRKTAQPVIETIPAEKQTSIALEKETLTDNKQTSTGDPVLINTSNRTSAELVEVKPEEKKTAISADKPLISDNNKTSGSKDPVLVNINNRTSAELVEVKPEEKKTAIGADKPLITDNNKTNGSKDPVIVNTNNRTSAGIAEVIVPEKKTAINQEKQTAEPYQVNPQTGYIEATPVRTPASFVKTADPVNTGQSIQKTGVTETNYPLAKQDIKSNTPVFNTDAAKLVAEREFEKPQEVNFKSDSLVIALFDNGEVDGDTVSVLLNGEVIVAKQCLKTTAFKKTIYIPRGEYQANIVLYAENLGIYPPNTGLLVIYDGDDRYNVRFSADLKKNAAIVLKRKQ